MRTGIGYDIHRLTPTIKFSSIPIGGVEIPCYYKTQAHSDGDVLLHALVDACLGALALGDLGQWFPDTARENEKRPSSDFVKEVMEKISKMGWEVHQFDAIIFLEEPKLAPYSDKIREMISKLLSVELSSISIKAKTMEGLGPIGENRAISAQTVITLKEISKNASANYK